MDLTSVSALASVDPAARDALVGEDGSPFLEWPWLAGLEASGCAVPETGWTPRHLLVRDADGRLVGACPLYEKTHSHGEFVFDHSWALAAERAGIAYYPKLLSAVPFTPVSGARLLVAPDVDRAELAGLLAEGLLERCRSEGRSSIHVDFCLEREARELAALGFATRRGLAYHWRDRDHGDFGGWLGSLRHKRRSQVRRERRLVAEAGVDVAVLAGDALPDALFSTLFDLYRGHVARFGPWGRRYLTRGFFDWLARRWRHRLVAVIARRSGRVVAAALNVRKGRTLYGRYWGASEEIPCLHFEVCYYAAIEWCLDHGVRRFDAGVQGGFKRTRGLDPTPTVSMHFLEDPLLAEGVGRFLAWERTELTETLALLRKHTAGKRGR